MRIGDCSDIEWIRSATHVTRAITSAIPPIFDAYATLELPGTGFNAEGPPHTQQDHDRALLAVLQAHCKPQPWWLGYLDTGAAPAVLPGAPRVHLYAHWSYVVAEGGPHQAATWRGENAAFNWKGALPDLMFPADHTWLVSTLWDDDWTCIGGSADLVRDLTLDSELGSRVRRVDLAEDITPPGHHMY